MEEKRFSGIGKEENFLSYLNDDNETISGFFEILEVNSSYVKIKTRGNITLIPMHRVLKIKFKDILK